jgi:hypothetical protein
MHLSPADAAGAHTARAAEAPFGQTSCIGCKGTTSAMREIPDRRELAHRRCRNEDAIASDSPDARRSSDTASCRRQRYDRNRADAAVPSDNDTPAADEPAGAWRPSISARAASAFVKSSGDALTARIHARGNSRRASWRRRARCCIRWRRGVRWPPGRGAGSGYAVVVGRRARRLWREQSRCVSDSRGGVMSELLLMPPVAVAHPPPCRSSTPVGRRATRGCATRPIRRRSRRSSP